MTLAQMQPTPPGAAIIRRQGQSSLPQLATAFYVDLVVSTIMYITGSNNTVLPSHGQRGGADNLLNWPEAF